MRFMVWGFLGTIVFAPLLSGCECDCKSGVMLDLPKIEQSTPGPVRVSWFRTGESEARIVCSWEAANASDAGWSCSPTPRSADDYGTEIRLHYDDATPSADWAVTLEGPTGMLQKTIPAESTDPGEGWPGTCVCNDYEATVEARDLTSLGAKTKS
jgi:hypothetical protein